MPIKFQQRVHSYSVHITSTSVVAGEPPQVTNFEDRVYGQYEYTIYRDGVSNPLWRTTIKNRGNATTPMTGTMVRVLEAIPFAHSMSRRLYDGNGVFLYSYSESVQGFSIADAQIPYHLSGTDLAEADNKARSQTLKRLSAEQSRSQGLVILGELKEVIQTLRNPFARAKQHVSRYFDRVEGANKRFLKSDRGRKAARKSELEDYRKEKWAALADTAADAHLELAFSIKPLISDVKETAGAILQFQYDSRRSVVVGYGESSTAEDSMFSEYWHNYCQLDYHRIDKTVLSVRYKAAVDSAFGADFGSAQRLANLTGFSLDQFIPSLYELAPWSFLIDYWSNLGEVINAGCTSQRGVKFVVRTERLQTIRSQSSSPHLKSSVAGIEGFKQGTQDGGSSVLTRTNVNRSSSADIPMPTLMLSLPGKPMQWANMVALFQGRARQILTSR